MPNNPDRKIDNKRRVADQQNSCGNDDLSLNISCQNAASQVHAKDNAVNTSQPQKKKHLSTFTSFFLLMSWIVGHCSHNTYEEQKFMSTTFTFDVFAKKKSYRLENVDCKTTYLNPSCDSQRRCRDQYDANSGAYQKQFCQACTLTRAGEVWTYDNVVCPSGTCTWERCSNNGVAIEQLSTPPKYGGVRIPRGGVLEQAPTVQGTPPSLGDSRGNSSK
jgi:hypothetical protein